MSYLWKRTILRVPALVRFLPIYLREMTLSNLRVAVDAFRRNPRFTPGFVEVSVKGYDPIQQWEAACLISMTPGTLTIDLEDASGVLLVHALYMTSPDRTRSELETLIHQALGKPRP
ncbi:MAG: Na+/H+ antiporter subunit E [Akkermansiaceae bacterium]|nr:Na+/H+ antiporter subunit E [Akkermansiaceae bacterium]